MYFCLHFFPFEISEKTKKKSRDFVLKSQWMRCSCKTKTTSSSNFHGPERKNTTFYFYPPIKDELSVFPFPLKRNIFKLTQHGANKVLKQ